MHVSTIRPIAKKIDSFLERIGKRRLWIQTHDMPDPDAIASAEALRQIARSRGINARILANGTPNRRENRAMIKECRINVYPLESAVIRNPARSAWAYVDCVPGGSNVTLHPQAPGDLFLAIDHHGTRDPLFRNCSGGNYLVDTSAGATASLLTMALIDLEITYPPRLASALSYAIITDTQDFSRGVSASDLEVYSALFPHTNQKIISRLRNVTKPREYFQVVHCSIENALSYRHLSWAYIGKISGGESVAEMADYILSCERITWSFVLGFCGDRLYMSMRSSSPRAHCSRLIRRISRGFDSTVGGHTEFAGGSLRLEENANPGDVAETLIRRYLRLGLRLKKSAADPEGTPFVVNGSKLKE